MYVVYVNHPTNKAIVHDTECGKYTNRRRDRTPMDIGQKPLKVLKKHGITLRGQGKRMLTHVLYASGKKNWKLSLIVSLREEM